MDGSEEGCGSFVVSACDGAEHLELGEEVLDEVAGAVEVRIVFAPIGAVDFGRDHGGNAQPLERSDHALVCIICAVGEQRSEAAGELGDEGVGPVQVVEVAGRQVDGDRVAERVAERVDLGGQPALAAADRLGLAGPPFAPALAWCAVTMVASSMAYSPSPSADKASNTRRHTPDRLQRMCRR